MAISISENTGGGDPTVNQVDVSQLDMGNQTTTPTPVVGTTTKNPWENPYASLPGEALSKLGSAITTVGQDAADTFRNIVTTQQYGKATAAYSQARAEAQDQIQQIQTTAAHDPANWSASDIKTATQNAWTSAYHKYMDPLGDLVPSVARHIAREKGQYEDALNGATNQFIGGQTRSVQTNALTTQLQAANDQALTMSQDTTKGPGASAAAHDWLKAENDRIQNDPQFGSLDRDTIQNIGGQYGAKGDASISQGALQSAITNLTTNINTDPVNNKQVTADAIASTTAEINASNLITPEEKQTRIIQASQQIQKMAKEQYSSQMEDQRQNNEQANLRRETLTTQLDKQFHDMVLHGASSSTINGAMATSRAQLLKNTDFTSSPQGMIALNRFGILQDEIMLAAKHRDEEATNKQTLQQLGMAAGDPESLKKDYDASYGTALKGTPLYAAQPDAQSSAFARYSLPQNGLGRGFPKQPVEEAEGGLFSGNAAAASQAASFLGQLQTRMPSAYGATVSPIARETVRRIQTLGEDPATASQEARATMGGNTPVLKSDATEQVKALEHKLAKDNGDTPNYDDLIQAAQKAGIGTEVKPHLLGMISMQSSQLDPHNVTPQVAKALTEYTTDFVQQGQSPEVARQSAISKLTKTVGYSRFTGSDQPQLMLMSPEQLAMGNGGGLKSSVDAATVIDADVKTQLPFKPGQPATATSPATQDTGIPPDQKVVLQATGFNQVGSDGKSQLPSFYVGYVNKDGGVTQIPGGTYAFDPKKNEISDRAATLRDYTGQAQAYSQLAIAKARSQGLMSNGGTQYGRYVQAPSMGGSGAQFVPEVETKMPSYDVRSKDFPKSKAEMELSAQKTMGFDRSLWEQAGKVHDIQRGASVIGEK